MNKQGIKVPPNNKEAEQSVLGAILIDKESLIKVVDILDPKDFYIPAHEKIYEIILELFEKHQPIDILSLTSRLKERGYFQDIGGSGYLADLTNQVPTAAHIENYAKIVREKHILRELITTATQIAEDSFDPENEVEDLLDQIEQKIISISQRSISQNFVHIKEELKSAYERIEKLHQGDGSLRGVPTGFKGLDNILSGFQKSDLVVLGARPSLGKTAFSLDIARNAALKHGIPVGYFSLEMSREQVIDRLISSESQVSLWKLRTGRIKDDMEFEMIQHALIISEREFTG
jgi:replicative DNA helicase